jgi:hypothetical protein
VAAEAPLGVVVADVVRVRAPVNLHLGCESVVEKTDERQNR